MKERFKASRVGGLTLRVSLVMGLLSAGLATGAFEAASAFDCEAPQQAPLVFKEPVFIDEHRSGGEPVSVVAKDGSIIVGAHLGTTLAYARTIPDPEWLAQYRNQTFIWRSEDNGTTWQRSELAIPGAHSASSTGFSDPDWAIDSAGNIYGTEIDLANVAVFSSHDNGKTWPDANPVADTGDRPWLAARGPDEVYLRITGNLQKSTDGGATWEGRTDPNAYGKIFVDPTDPNGLYAGNNSGVGVQVSRDDGNSWHGVSVPGASNASVMKSIGVDNEGWVYYGWVQGKEIRFSSFDPATEEWAEPVTIATAVNPMWAWTVAGDSGRAAVAWYDRTPVAGSTSTYNLTVNVAVTENARGSSYDCDGTEVALEPQFSVATNAAGRAVHIGSTPCNGTGCNATGDRRLGDFFTINYAQDGRVFVTTGDTTIPNAADMPNTVSYPLFMIADENSPRLTAPAAP